MFEFDTGIKQCKLGLLSSQTVQNVQTAKHPNAPQPQRKPDKQAKQGLILRLFSPALFDLINNDRSPNRSTARRLRESPLMWTGLLLAAAASCPILVFIREAVRMPTWRSLGRTVYVMLGNDPGPSALRFVVIGEVGPC